MTHFYSCYFINITNDKNTQEEHNIYFIFIKIYLIYNILREDKIEQFNHCLKNLNFLKGDYMKRKRGEEYLFSPLDNDNKKLTKSNSIKDLDIILTQFNNYINKKTFELKFKYEIKLNDLFIDNFK